MVPAACSSSRISILRFEDRSCGPPQGHVGQFAVDVATLPYALRADFVVRSSTIP